MGAWTVLPLLVLPLLFVLHELERWALKAPTESPGERDRRSHPGRR